MMIRVLAHAHSTWSYDGRLSLEQWIVIARERSCSAVLLAEHEESGWTTQRYAEYVAACRRASGDDVRLVPGVEFNQSGYHVLCYGLTTWPLRPCSAEGLASAAHAQGCLLCLAHPGRYFWTFPAPIVDMADAVEVWNSSWVADGNLGPHPRTLALLGTREILVGQDVHKRRHLGHLYLIVDGDDPIAALREGAFDVEFRGRRWSREDLRKVGIRNWLQCVRTHGVRAALRGYRWWHRRRRGKSTSGTASEQAGGQDHAASQANG